MTRLAHIAAYLPLSLVAAGIVEPQQATQQSAGRVPVVSAERLERPAPDEWLQVGRDYSNQRYSPLARITPRNVARLTPRSLFQLEPPQLGAGAEAAPLVADGRMYVTTDYGAVHAFDLRTRARLWRYAPKLGIAKPCCGPVNRGVALGAGLVFLGTLDSRLIALDAATGKVRWEVVNNDPDSAYSITMAPLVVRDRVIVGTSGGEFPTRGSVTAYDARTGARLWRWYAVPSPEEGGWWGKWTPVTPTGENLKRDIARERADSARYADSWKIGGGPVWAQPAYDPESATLYVVVGNPAPSNDGRGRPGDNLYTGSVVALDVATGKMRWYFQAVPHDVWDYDFANPPVLVRVGSRKLVLAAGKMGWVYALDATTGALVYRSQPFVPQLNLFTPPTAEGVKTAPGPAGGANWPPSAYSPATGLFYVLGLHFPFTITRAEAEAQKGEFWIGGDYKPLAGETMYGTLTAMNPSTGKIAWARRTDPQWSGALVTASGLLFVGDVNGWFRAYDAKGGQPLWEFFAGAGVNAPAVSFELDGEQYIAVVAAGSRYSSLRGSALLVFGLGAGTTADVSARPANVAPVRSSATVTPGRAVDPARSDAWPPRPPNRVHRYLAYDAAARVVWIDLSTTGPIFNTPGPGARTHVVPLGWRVEVRFRNDDAMPHSARVVADMKPIPLVPGPVSFAGAETESPLGGLPAGARDQFAFIADRPGEFLIACAVPGHAAGGMVLKLVVAPHLTAPTAR